MHRTLVLLLSACAVYFAQDSGNKLQKALKDEDLVGPWIYDDIPAGFAEAKRTGKPLMIVFR